MTHRGRVAQGILVLGLCWLMLAGCMPLRGWVMPRSMQLGETPEEASSAAPSADAPLPDVLEALGFAAEFAELSRSKQQTELSRLRKEQAAHPEATLKLALALSLAPRGTDDLAQATALLRQVMASRPEPPPETKALARLLLTRLEQEQALRGREREIRAQLDQERARGEELTRQLEALKAIETIIRQRGQPGPPGN